MGPAAAARDAAVFVLRGGNGTVPEKSRGAVEGFQERGGILLATTAVMSEGLSLPQVESLILYDLPRSQLMIQRIIGRFQELRHRTDRADMPSGRGVG